MGGLGLGLAIDPLNILVIGRTIQSTERYLEKFEDLEPEGQVPEMPRPKAVSSNARIAVYQPQRRTRPRRSSGAVTT